jgi:hypothetical protein
MDKFRYLAKVAAVNVNLALPSTKIRRHFVGGALDGRHWRETRFERFSWEIDAKAVERERSTGVA